MHSFVKKTTIVLSTFTLTAAMAGCDLINPPKKANTKTPTTVKAADIAVSAEQGPLPKNAVARVGNWTLTEEQFGERLKLLKEGLPDFDPNKPGNKEAVLNELVRQQLLVRDAEDTGIAEKKDIVDAVEDFRRTLLVQELANRLTKDVVATEKDAQKYYDENKELFIEPIQWKVSEIVVADEAAAKAVLVQVLQGGVFADIAKAQSKGKTAPAGGELAGFTKAPFAAMQTAIASLDVGATSNVFKGPEGFYIVKVDGKKGGAAKPFAEVKADVISGLTLRKQQEAILGHIDSLAKKIKVEVNKDLLGTGAAK